VTQFYHGAASQQAASLFAGGSQDNGTEITFGNRTWYQPGGCDGSDVAVDATDTDTLFANCNGGLFELANPVPGTTGGGNTISMSLPSGVSLTQPLVTNPSVAHFSLAAGTDKSSDVFILKTTDNVTWTQTGSLPVGGSVTALASAPSSAQTMYAGLNTPTILHSINGGTNWVNATSGLPTNLRPNAIAVDFTNASRAIAAMGGSAGAGIYLTTDGGATWNSISGSGTGAIPNAPLTGVVIDPSNANVLYVSSSIGVFKGTLAGTTWTWVPFDEGIPDGLDVNEISVNRANFTLSIASFGHGTYQRDINPAHSGGGAIAVVRDVVSDTGIGPSDSSGVPDPEHPIPDPARANFYVPNNSPGGLLYWWDSPDIRIDVPSADPTANAIANADSVEMETCPIEITDCPPGTMMDSNPVAGKPAKVYVDVANQGLAPASNVRVIAMYADASVQVPPLPANFWTTTFPAGSTTCGALDTSTGWHLPDPAHACATIGVVNPEYPQTAEFNWNVSSTQAQHSCMLVITESNDDPLPASIRSSNIVQTWQLVPQNHQIAQRNLHIVTSSAPGAPASGMEVMMVPNTADADAVTLAFDRSLLPAPGTLSVFLPKGTGKLNRGFKIATSNRSMVVDKAVLAYADKYDIDLSTEYIVTSDFAELPEFPVAHGQTRGIVLRYSSGVIPPDHAVRFTVLQRAGATVTGGSTFVLRSLADRH